MLSLGVSDPSDTAANDRAFPLRVWAPLTDATDSSSSHDAWPTPTVDDANNVTRASGAMQSLARDSHQWATPRAEDGERGQGSQFDGLPEDVRAWASPVANQQLGASIDALQKEALRLGPQGRWSLGTEIATWSTPTTPAPHDSDYTAGQGYQNQANVAKEAVQWATPLARDVKDVGRMQDARADGTPRNDNTGRQALAWHHGTRSRTGETSSPSEASTTPSDSFRAPRGMAGLNPRFGLWLMGFPPEWLDSVPSGTRSSRRSPSSSGGNSSRSRRSTKRAAPSETPTAHDE